MKSSPLAPFLVIVLTVCGLFVMQAKDKRIRDDDPLMERYRHAELEVKQAVSEGRISREEAGRKLREIKGNLWGGEERRIVVSIRKTQVMEEFTKISIGSKKRSRRVKFLTRRPAKN